MINRDKLLHLMDGDEALVEKFLSIFKEQVSEQLPLMQDHLRNGNRPLLSNIAHIMKSQTAYLSLDELSALSQTIEQMADSGADLEFIRPHVTFLIEKLTFVIQTELS